MQARLKLKPGQRGTKKELAQYGDKLVCVRYRYDAQRKKRYKTVELIVDEVDWTPRPRKDAMVGVRVKWGEAAVARRVKLAGGQWNAKQKVWELRYGQVRALGLEERMVELSIQR